MTPDYRIVVVGASAGGVTSLQELVAGLPPTLNAAVFVVLHIRPDATSHLAEILSSRGTVPASNAEDGEEIRPGRIYVSRPDHHLLIESERIVVRRGPKENRFRPSVDALFRSAAYTHGPRVIGIVMSGALDDGTSGLWSIRRFGGVTIVQDPQDASFDSMPLSALDQVEVDHTLAARDIGPLVATLAGMVPVTPVDPPAELLDRTRIETEVAASANAFAIGAIKHGERTVFTCPECHGALVRITEDGRARYRCHTGHGFTSSALLAGMTEAVEPALWQATRALEEVVMLLDEMARSTAAAGRPEVAERFSRKARETEERARIIQGLAVRHEHLSRAGLTTAQSTGPGQTGE